MRCVDLRDLCKFGAVSITRARDRLTAAGIVVGYVRSMPLTFAWRPRGACGRRRRPSPSPTWPALLVLLPLFVGVGVEQRSSQGSVRTANDATSEGSRQQQKPTSTKRRRVMIGLAASLPSFALASHAIQSIQTMVPPIPLIVFRSNAAC